MKVVVIVLTIAGWNTEHKCVTIPTLSHRFNPRRELTYILFDLLGCNYELDAFA